jgi:hypothetical protein
MKRYIYSFILISALTVHLQAANHYIRPGASGNGSDWANARGTIPSTLVRGDTYYLADGEYGAVNLTKVSSGGTSPIKIFKATEKEHGTSTGWQTSYGDGEAHFSSINIGQSYLVFDGKKRDPDWEGGYGFRVGNKSCVRSSSGYINITNYAKHVTVAYTHIDHCDKPACGRGLRAVSGPAYLTMHHCLTSFISNPILTRSVHNSRYEYNFFADGYSDPGCHGEAFSSVDNNVTVRYNKFRNIRGTGVIVISGSGWQVYGNVIYSTGSAAVGNGTITGWTGSPVSSTKIHNNTIANYPKGSITFPNGSGNIASNNLFYNNGHKTSSIGGSNDVFITSSVFANATGFDFRLRQATQAGKILTTPYNQDMEGNTRGADGVWDLGAFEYSKTNIEYRTPNVECRIPAPLTYINDLHFYNLTGNEILPGQFTQSGIYLVKDDAGVYIVTKIK